jgi:PII-like signaling protein
VHKDKPLVSSHHGSIMLSVIDSAEKLRAFLPVVDQMVEEGLVVFSDVDIVKYAYRTPDAGKQETAPASTPAEVRP